MGLSVNEFIYAGDDEFTLNFAMGYASRSDVTAYKVGDPNVDLSFDWLTDNQVRLASGQVLVNGDTIVFRRTVSKQSLPVDLTQPGEATRENLETMFKHGLYVAHEVLDERADFIPTNELVLPVSKGGTGADNATGAALNLGILAGINILAPENNLSDLASAVDALVNLGVNATAAELNALDGVTTKGTELVRATDEAAARAALGLGTAATATAGTLEGDIPVLGTGGKLDAARLPDNLGAWTYTSPATTLTAYTPMSFAHGLGAAPTSVEFDFVCTVANSGYSVGDRIIGVGSQVLAAANRGMNCYIPAGNTTELIVVPLGSLRFASATGAEAGLLFTQWDVVVKAKL